MPKVSVIIPTYNRARYVCEAIDSVLSQTFTDYEILVVDDGSTDNTKEALNKYKNKIRYFFQENRGVSAARNLGIKNAEGEYLAFLDSDDVWFPQKLALQTNILGKVPKDTAMVSSDGEMVEEAAGVVKKSVMRPRCPQKNSFKDKISQKEFNDGSIVEGYLYSELLQGNFILTPTVLLRKRCLDDIGGFDETLGIAEDYDLWLRIAAKYCLVYFNAVTVKCRIEEEGLSGVYGVREYRYRKADAHLFAKHFRSAAREYRELIKRRIVESSKIAAWGYLNMNEGKEVRQLCFQSLYYDQRQPKLYLYILISFLPVSFVRFLKRMKNTGMQ